MPHRKNAKGDIGNAKKWSDTYDADNIYLSEEGWVYRHFKNTDRTLWWDEIIVAGQVKPSMSIHGVDNGDSILGAAGGTYNDGVLMTNPYKLGTVADVNFQTGDGVNDYRYSDHAYRDSSDSIQIMDKIVIEKNDTYSGTGFDQIAWESINVDSPEAGDISTQIPAGWDKEDTLQGVSKPHNLELYAGEPPYPGEDYQSVNYYTVAPDSMPGVPPEINVGVFPDPENPDTVIGGGTAGKVPSPGDSVAAEDDHHDDSGGNPPNTGKNPFVSVQPILP